jgi:cation:H+ antiporter
MADRSDTLSRTRADAGTAWLRASWFWLALVLMLPLPAFALRLGAFSADVTLATTIYGLAVVGAAFSLTWASEAAEQDISQALALAVLALIAVLPEYAVDMTFAWKAGHDPSYTAYAAANMTGGNRLLVGLGWPVVVLVFSIVSRQKLLQLARSHALELTFLGIATLYSFTIPLKGSLAPFDAVVLIGLFCVYLWLAAKSPTEEAEPVGPAASIAHLPRPRRWLTLAGLFLYAAAAIIVSAEEFANGLVETGAHLGVDRFLLVQWVAPLASESPEMIAAVLLTLRGRAGAGMGALISSKINQWTLLVGGLPLVYSLSRGGLHALPLDGRQVEEITLTAAQSLFAVAVLLSLSLSRIEAVALFGLFAVQLPFESTTVRYLISLLYMLLTLAMIARQRHDLGALWRWWRAGRPTEAVVAPLADTPSGERRSRRAT